METHWLRDRRNPRILEDCTIDTMMEIHMMGTVLLQVELTHRRVVQGGCRKVEVQLTHRRVELEDCKSLEVDS